MEYSYSTFISGPHLFIANFIENSQIVQIDSKCIHDIKTSTTLPFFTTATKFHNTCVILSKTFFLAQTILKEVIMKLPFFFSLISSSCHPCPCPRRPLRESSLFSFPSESFGTCTIETTDFHEVTQTLKSFFLSLF